MAKKKEKIIWVDDGRTVADMSGISPRTGNDSTHGKYGRPSRYSAPLKEKLGTFFDAMGFMLLPTLAMVGLLCAVFAIVYILL